MWVFKKILFGVKIIIVSLIGVTNRLTEFWKNLHPSYIYLVNYVFILRTSSRWKTKSPKVYSLIPNWGDSLEASEKIHLQIFKRQLGSHSTPGKTENRNSWQKHSSTQTNGRPKSLVHTSVVHTCNFSTGLYSRVQTSSYPHTRWQPKSNTCSYKLKSFGINYQREEWYNFFSRTTEDRLILK